MPVDPAAIVGAASEDALSAFARRAGGAGGARTANVSRGHNVNRNANVNRNTNVNRNVNRNVNVNRAVVGGVGGVAVVRPVRPWVRLPYYGTVVAGVALGTVIAATTIPPAPSSRPLLVLVEFVKDQGLLGLLPIGRLLVIMTPAPMRVRAPAAD